MGKIITIVIGALFVFSCSDSDSIKKIMENQNYILKKLTTIENKIGNSPSQANKNKPKADPNKVYNIAEAGSIVFGNPKAPVTIIEWTDFQ